jgi:hypothetical protein
MPALKQHATADFSPARFARRFRQLVGLRFSHVCIAALLLAAMYLATESYSGETGYPGHAPGVTVTTR